MGGHGWLPTVVLGNKSSWKSEYDYKIDRHNSEWSHAGKSLWNKAWEWNSLYIYPTVTRNNDKQAMPNFQGWV